MMLLQKEEKGGRKVAKWIINSMGGWVKNYGKSVKIVKIVQISSEQLKENNTLIIVI